MLATPIAQQKLAVGSDNDWEIIRDDDNGLHLVELQEEDFEVDPSFNAWQDTNFILFTRRNRNDGQQLFLNNHAVMDNSQFNPAHPTR